MDTPNGPARQLFLLTIEPVSADGRWHASLVPVAPTSPSLGATQVFDSPLELARYVAQVSIPRFTARGLR